MIVPTIKGKKLKLHFFPDCIWIEVPEGNIKIPTTKKQQKQITKFWRETN